MSENKISVTLLGAGQEVGRSCILLSIFNRNIILDCGLHPGYSGISSLPYYDIVDFSKIDLLLVSHFHVDHCASLPYILSKEDFKAPVYMTAPTKSIYKVIVGDYLQVSGIAPKTDTTNKDTTANNKLYKKSDIQSTMKRIKTMKYHEKITINTNSSKKESSHEISFWCYNAGHVLGAAEFVVEVDGLRVLYTGDFSLLEDRHLPAAEIPKFENQKPLVTIMESTFGLQCHSPAPQREKHFIDCIQNVLYRNGSMLIPVFALGRAQELLLILEEHWAKNKHLQKFEIYFASNLASKCLPVYTTYSNMMNSSFQNKSLVSSPFSFKYIKVLSNSSDFYKRKNKQTPCVLFASPGMLQNGFSREIFEKWAPDKRNGLLITGYSVQGTLAKNILREPEEFVGLNGNSIKRGIEIFTANFAAHADFNELKSFVKGIDSKYYILVHGEKNEMGRLKRTLERDFNKDSNEKHFFMPKNCQTVKIDIAQKDNILIPSEYLPNPISKIENSKQLKGYILNNIFYKKADLMKTIEGFKLKQKMAISKICISDFFNIVGNIYNIERMSDEKLVISNNVLAYKLKNNIVVEWVCGVKTDSIAEVIMLIFSDEKTTNTIKKNINKRELIAENRNKENETVIQLLKESFMFYKENEEDDCVCLYVSNNTKDYVKVRLDKLEGPSLVKTTDETVDKEEENLVFEMIEIVKGFMRPIG